MKDPKGDKRIIPLLQYIPYVFLALYIGVIIFIIRRIPEPEEILQQLKILYGTYGYALVFAAALVESIFLLGFYVPGSTAILLGAVLARTGVIELQYVLLLATLGLVCGYTINYFLGRHGWYHVLSQFGLEGGITTAKEKIEKHGVKAILLGYLSPSTGAFLSTAAGISKMSFKKFFLLTILGQVFWSILWGGTAYFFGMLFVEVFMKYFGLVVFAIVGLFFLRKYLSQRKEKNKT